MSERSERYVVVCRGPHCRERGSLPLRSRLVALLRGQTRLGLVGYACFGQCEHGPNVAIYPDGAWYGGLCRASDADHVVQQAAAGRPLEADQLTLPEDERAGHLRNIAELVETIEKDRSRGRGRRRWWPFG